MYVCMHVLMYACVIWRTRVYVCKYACMQGYTLMRTDSPTMRMDLAYKQNEKRIETYCAAYYVHCRNKGDGKRETAYMEPEIDSNIYRYMCSNEYIYTVYTIGERENKRKMVLPWERRRDRECRWCRKQ